MGATGDAILVVDSDAERGQRLVALASRLGSRSEAVETAAEGAARMRRADYGLVLLSLPLQGGLGTLLRELERSCSVLGCVGPDDTRSRDEALACGARVFVPLQDHGAKADADKAATEAVERGLALRQQVRGAGADYQRLRLQYQELQRIGAQQSRDHQESQETFYLDLSRMMTIIGSIMDGIVFVDRDGRITLLNPVAEDLLGVKAFIAMGRSPGELEGQADLVGVLREDQGKAIDGQECNRIIEVHDDEHDLCYIRVQTTRVSDYRGRFAGALSVLQDVTSDYKTDQLKNQYLSIVAHELRTPLTGIKTFSTMMAKGTLGKLEEAQQRVMESIREQSLRLEHQIDKLINLGHLESAEYGADPATFEAEEFLQQVVAPFQQAAEDRSIEVDANYSAPPACEIQADRADLRRACQALVENAVKFTQDGGKVAVEIGVEDDGGLFLKVADNGIGIDPRYHRRIFEKFFQVEDPLTRHFGGAGLGLFVAKGILDAHGCTMTVRSELGAGASFRFPLPMQTTANAENPPATAI